MTSSERILYLLQQVQSKAATPAECDELLTLIDADEQSGIVKMINEYHLNYMQREASARPVSLIDWSDAAREVLEVTRNIEQEIVLLPTHRKMKWWWAAATILLVLGIGGYFWVTNNKNQPSTIAAVNANEIPPGKDGAILTLADGSQLVLDSMKEGAVADQNGAQVMIKNGGLAYQLSEHTSNEVVYNTMSTPKGRQFSILLPDGTKAWLNAASSLRYPTVFKGKERRVLLTGEAYFEVAQNQKTPFKVSVDNMEVEVLGTAFNINGYANEGKLQTTLLEGAVRVRFDTDRVLLKPGQQAVLAQSAYANNPGEKFIVDNHVDMGQVVAWKNGIFNFNNTDLFTVMRQLERWYGIEVEYEDNVAPFKFFGKMRRDLPLSVVLNWLKGVGVNYRFNENKKLIIMP